MKQTMMICIYIFLLLSGALAGLTKEETARASADEPVVIPDEAIRLRILANSDNDEDQKLKRQIRDAVNVYSISDLALELLILIVITVGQNPEPDRFIRYDDGLIG